MGDRWATSNSEYGRGVVIQANKRGEDYYSKLASQSRMDAKVAAQLQQEAWKETTLRVADAKVAPAVASSPAARPPNSARLPPTEVQSEGQRLRERLRQFGLREQPIVGDGACMFRAVADQLWGDQERHVQVRQRAIEMLRKQKDHFAAFVPDDETFDQYLTRMARPAEWGDNLMLQVRCTRVASRVALTPVRTTAPDDARRPLRMRTRLTSTWSQPLPTRRSFASSHRLAPPPTGGTRDSFGLASTLTYTM